MSAPQHSRRRARTARSRPPIPRLGLGLGQCRLGQDPCAGAARDPAAARRRRPGESSASPSPRPPRPTWRSACSRRSANGPRSTMPRSTRRSQRSRAAAPDAQRAPRARRLFAPALETPGGLKVQTIHAFCTRLLHQFPFEADVAARFEVLEDAREHQLLDELRARRAARSAAASPRAPLGRALATAITAAADQTFDEVSTRRSASATTITHWIAHAGGVDAAIARTVARARHARRTTRRERSRPSSRDSPHLPQSEWPALAAALAAGLQDRPASSADALRSATALRTAASASRSICRSSAPTSWQPRKSVVTKAIATKHPPTVRSACSAEQERVCAPARAPPRRRDCRDRTAALLTIAHEVIERYRAEKDRRGLLDYDDLIDRTLALLADRRAAWVHYKLDLGIDHVLVDEAQDTSPKQWEIIQRAGRRIHRRRGRARRRKRTIFAVGDEKQSIFSFQGAAPEQFAEMRRHFEAALRRRRDCASPTSNFDHSFRSGADRAQRGRRGVRPPSRPSQG